MGESTHHTDPDERHEVDAGERLRASRAIGLALRRLNMLRVLLVYDAVLLLVLSFLLHGSGHTAMAVGVFGVALLALAGARFLMRAPVAWTVVLATMHTAFAVLFFVIQGKAALSTQGFKVIGFVVALWSMVLVARRALRAVEQYPDAWAARRYLGTGRDLATMGTRHRDAARVRAAARRRSILILVGGSIACAVLAAWMFGTTRENVQLQDDPAPAESLEDAAVRLELAWNVEGLDAVVALVRADRQAQVGPALERLCTRRGWDPAALPGIEFRGAESVSPWKGRVTWVLEDVGELRASWVAEDGRWWIYAFKLRGG